MTHEKLFRSESLRTFFSPRLLGRLMGRAEGTGAKVVFLTCSPGVAAPAAASVICIQPFVCDELSMRQAAPRVELF